MVSGGQSLARGSCVQKVKTSLNQTGSRRRPLVTRLSPHRYVLDSTKRPHIKIQPPFIRPDLSDRQMTVKVSDNGLHGTIVSSKVRPAGFILKLNFHFYIFSILHFYIFSFLHIFIFIFFHFYIFSFFSFLSSSLKSVWTPWMKTEPRRRCRPKPSGTTS